MEISFNPAVGDAVNVLTPQAFPGTHITPLLFTAQLSATDHSLMVSKGGRVQLWSNLPHDGERNDAWQELDFTDTCGSERRFSDSDIIQLGDNVLPQNHQIKNLHLLILFSPMTSGTQYFSFTYRIVYASGEVTWFGAFGQNGMVSLLPSSSNFLNSLVLEEKWGLDLSRRVQRLEITESTDALQIAKLNNLVDFRIWGLATRNLGKLPCFSWSPVSDDSRLCSCQLMSWPHPLV
ncbi:hypothetical protein GALMADRAFT_217883 [Galerina marginata CBS 339.88]|uniref:Uncharacterized protein n=1 Tax=Galerina marginata (strain CBS 339.88) TaxID=685588 RepID=A0A067U0E4_GALM3|nr:hypothetical protein GALMADRAFT_217883 [Galerina marginata CBS 339.88]